MKTNIKIIIGVVVAVLISVSSCYVLADSIIDSKSVYYKDNSGLAVNNVQDAIDGTCTKFDNNLTNLKKELLNEMYPVGSIYISTTLSTAAQVKAALGGEWQAYGNDKVLRGTSSKAEVTGGSDTVTLTTDNLPSHTHSFTPAGSVSSTFKGTAVTSGNQSANHTHTFSGTTAPGGGHSHTIGLNADAGIVGGHFYYGVSTTVTGYLTASGYGVGSTSSVANHSHSYSGTTSANSANHTHSVTAAGTVTSTFTGTASNTGATGGGKSFSVQNSYITVFMYKRTAVSTIIDSKEVSYDNKTSNGSYDNVQNSIDGLYQKYKDFTGEQDTLYTEKILNGADPVLRKDMIPITLDGKGNVKYASLYTPWYKYEEKKWANAVILVRSPSKQYKVGDTILEKDIESYFVWIPRYSYKIWDLGNYTSYQTLNSLVNNSETAMTGNQTALRRIMGNARIIDVRFGKDENLTSIPTTTGVYYTHPAFTNFGVSGLWVGKFETGYNQMDITGVPIDTTGWTTEGAESDVVSSSRIIVKPNVYSWRYIKLSNIFTNTIDYEPDLKSHMMKNTEWGAVAYLSHSIYGIGNEVNINNNESYKTGYSAAANTDKSSWEYGTEDIITQAYNTTTGYLASTTGNITGIYDMNGGCYESVAGYRKGQNTNLSGISDSVLSTYANYFDAYYEGSDTYAYVNRKLGDATGEMGPFYAYYDKDGVSRVHNNWYSDDSAFVDSNNFWFLRSGSFSAGTISGQFSFIRVNGVAGRNIGFRLILAVK